MSDFTTAGQVTIKIGSSEYKVTGLGDAFDTGLTMYLGAGNYGGSMGSGMQGRIYGCKIYEGAELKRDFVPCVSAKEGAGSGIASRASSIPTRAARRSIRRDWWFRH